MKLTSAARKRIPRSKFAIPSKAPGSGSFPIEDPTHAQNALARSSGKPVAAQVRAAVARRYPGMVQGGNPVDTSGLDAARVAMARHAARARETGVSPARSQAQGGKHKHRNKKQIRGHIAAIRAGGKVARTQGGKGPSAGIYE